MKYITIGRVIYEEWPDDGILEPSRNPYRNYLRCKKCHGQEFKLKHYDLETHATCVKCGISSLVHAG